MNSLDNIPLSDMSFENITSQSVAYLFIFFHRVCHSAGKFNFNEVQLINSFFHGSYLWCHI